MQIRSLDRAVLAALLVLIHSGLSYSAEILVEQGTLQPGDRRLDANEYYDVFTFEGQAGQRILIELDSDDFDPYLMLQFPGGELVQNDDSSNASQSLIRAAIPETGTYEITVTSFAGLETGNYSLAVSSDDSGFASVEEGSLAEGDGTLDNGEYYDTFSIDGQAGQRLEIRLASDEFDPYLMLESPDGSLIEHDDLTETADNCVIHAIIPAGGEYLVHVTSFAADETGAYRLVINQYSVPGTTEKGRLQNGDATLEETGEFYDSYTVEGRRGEVLDLLVASTDFDPYVIVVAPDGTQYDNDDAELSLTHAGLRLLIDQNGTYEIMVTSYEEGEAGQYYLSIGKQ
jgi:hypothetical protein